MVSCWLVSHPAQLVSSLFVSKANRIAARTACSLGAHFGPSDAAFPPTKNGRLPIFACPTCRMPSRCVSHLAHRNRKCSIVSGACPQSHMSVCRSNPVQVAIDPRHARPELREHVRFASLDRVVQPARVLSWQYLVNGFGVLSDPVETCILVLLSQPCQC
jgi:hypothetical protein